MSVFSLNSTVDGLVEAVNPLSMRPRAALFGACGTVLLPLLEHVERMTAQKWSFPSAREALTIVADYATGMAAEGDYADLRRLLFASGPNGHELDSPWSTYAQDALTCIDAGLVASSVTGQRDFRASWIFSALEPMVTSLNDRGYDVEFDAVEIGSTDLQREIDSAVAFLFSAVTDLLNTQEVSPVVYAQLIEEAFVIAPSFGS
jgi:hypothetical protein